jgi:hypothetical protein
MSVPVESFKTAITAILISFTRSIIRFEMKSMLILEKKSHTKSQLDRKKIKLPNKDKRHT